MSDDKARPPAARKTKPGSAAELAELYPAPKSIAVKLRRVDGDGDARVIHWDDATVTVDQMSVEQIGNVISVIKPIIQAQTKFDDIVALAAEYPNEIIGMVAIAIDWPVAKVNTIGGADFMEVAIAVFALNSDFFKRRFANLASGSEFTATMAALMNGGGATPSVSSPNADASTPSG